MNKLFKEFKFGVTVKEVKLQNIDPPKLVHAAFEDVNKAQQDAKTYKNKGLEAKNKEIPKAKGVKERTIREARGYATEKINKALGDIARFNKVYGEYVKNPEITRMRLYYEMFEKVFSNTDSIDLIDKKLKNFIPFKALSDKKGSTK
jgi:membrane protease subunit HflK